MSIARSPAVVGVDVGGTFTDFVAVLDEGRLIHYKEPSTPADPSIAIKSGLQALIRREPSIGDNLLVVHGTTIGLNAVLQRKGARVALIVSRGTKDVLEIARCRVPSRYSSTQTKSTPLVMRDHVLEIGARLDSGGRIAASPTAMEIEEICARIRALGVEAVAIMLLHSYLNPKLEDMLATAIQERLPDLLVTRSARVWPEIREYERSVVACLNAQIHPMMDRYLSGLSTHLDASASKAMLMIASSSGGSLSVHSARERPIETLLSGPACGVMAAAGIAKSAGITSAVTFDMGGTSADIAVLTENGVQFTTAATVGDLPIMMPVVGVNSIGAGGGSIISVDAQGIIKVGPESAGAFPGPACYGLGGRAPTVTDCYLVMGFIDPAAFLGGRVQLDTEAADRVLADIAARLGLPSAAHAAEAAISVATARMATEMFKLLAQMGLSPSSHVLIPFGGAGPTHAALLAEEAGLSGVAVPPAASTFCALGAATADVRREFVVSFRASKLASLGSSVWSNWKSMESEGARWLEGEGVSVLGNRYEYSAEMRYRGQSHNLNVRIADAVRRAGDIDQVAEAFHLAHENIYGFRERDEDIEIVTQRLSMIGRVLSFNMDTLLNTSGLVEDVDIQAQSHRAVFHRGTWYETAVFTAAAIPPSAVLNGPAIVEYADTTIWIPPGWNLRSAATGVLLVNRVGNDEN